MSTYYRLTTFEYLLIVFYFYPILFDEEDRQNPLLNEFRGHRAIGVVYNPNQESGNYVPTILPMRYDSFIFIRETNPLQPVR